MQFGDNMKLFYVFLIIANIYIAAHMVLEGKTEGLRWGAVMFLIMAAFSFIVSTLKVLSEKDQEA